MSAQTKGYVRMPDGLVVGPWGFPKVAGRCPACGAESLFLAVGGHVTCAVIACSDPCAADELLAKEWDTFPRAPSTHTEETK